LSKTHFIICSPKSKFLLVRNKLVFWGSSRNIYQPLANRCFLLASQTRINTHKHFGSFARHFLEAGFQWHPNLT